MDTQHVTMNITPPKATLEVLKRDFAHCFDKDGNFDIEKFKQEISGPEVNFSSESYGMDWLGKSYARVRSTDPATTLLKEDISWNSKEENKKSENLLIKGDNLEVLKHLSHAYHEQVKMIYIDPPYNTGTDGFVYEDDRKFTPEEFAELAGVDLEQAKRILDFVDSKSNSHSAWLSFMYPRLYIARLLLKDDGVIFVSIDDNEVAQLRILMDEIFGPTSFVAKIPWRKRTAKSDVPYGISQDFEWILAYAKIDFLAGIAQERKYYTTPDFPGDRWRLSDLTKQTSATERPNSAFEMVNPKDGKKHPFNPNRTWSVTKDTFKQYYDNGKIVFPGDYDFLNISIPAYRVFESEDKAKAKKKYGTEESVKAVSTQLTKEVGLSEDGNKDIVELFDSKIFSFPKPVSLIKYLIDIVNSGDEDSIILDFFAGSGTTGHAIMKLNAEDGGSRKHILVSLPEKIDPVKSKAAFDFVKNILKIKEPTIFDITKERLVRAAKKIKEEHKDSEHIASVDFGF
jgi:adenine-specific DNA-methyltransferase